MAAQLPAHVTPRAVPYFRLAVGKAFASLTPAERLYAHHMNRAGWHGAPVCSAQVSTESPQLLKFLYTLFHANPVPTLREAAAGVDKDEFDRFLEYAALAYSNLGNYLSFGDSKFIPAVERTTVDRIVEAAPNNRDAVLALYKSIADRIFSADAGELSMGHPPKGRTAFYSPDLSVAEIEAVDAYLTSRRIEGWNTRMRKAGDKHVEVLIACAKANTVTHTTPDGMRVDLVYGDHSEYFARVAASLEAAAAHAQSAEQREMLKHYVAHFNEGHIEQHKESQRWWVKDKSPAVETNIGFIETYRDPQGVRAEWEGFVAVVDKEQSKMYAALVAGGQDFIKELPWGSDFEREVFKHPDFTSLEVLGFASSGIPLGICIPNYDDVRDNVGFKNVMLGNTVSAINFNDKMNHLTDADWALYKEHFLTAMSINVGVHELLGHGTGKLLAQNEDGSFNFNKGELVNPLTGKPIETFYKPGETWGLLFKDTANPYEECRAEAVALFLSLNREILRIFGRTSDAECLDTVHIVWLNMIRSGLISLEFYTPEKKQWRQAHCRARYCILQTLLRAPNPIVKITHDPANNVLEITVDKERIATDGRAAIGELLRHLNINKAIADVAAGTAYFDGLTAVDEEFLGLRDTVMRMRKPRKQFVQAHTRLNADGTDVELEEFDSSVEGAIAAMVARHTDIPL